MAVLALHQVEPKSDKSYIFWFLVAVAYNVPWTAISSLLGQFSYHFKQPRILLYLNLAYFLPSVPALLIHSSLQERLERRYGLPKAALLRFIIGLGGLCVLCLILPHCCHSPQLLLAATAAVGVLYSIAFGTSYQVVTHFPPTCTVALTTGFVCCGLVVLAADLLLKTGPYYTATGLTRLFQIMTLQTAVGMFAAYAVLKKHWRRLAAAAAGDLAAAAGPAAAAAVGDVGRGASGRMIIGLPSQISSSSSRLMMRSGSAAGGWISSSSSSHWQQQQQRSAAASGYHIGSDHLRHRSDAEADHHHGQQHDADPAAAAAAVSITLDNSTTHDLSLDRQTQSPKKHKRNSYITHVTQLLLLCRVIWPACLSLMMSVGSSMLVFPFFTFVPHSGRFGEHLPQVLFYSRLLGDIVGRIMPHQLHLRSTKSLLAAAAAKTKLLMLLIPALLTPTIVGGDVMLALLVAVNWWLSGYINTGAYLLAPKLAAASSSSRKGSTGGIKTKAGGLMAFCFQTSCFIGLLGAWIIQSLVLADWRHAAIGAGAESLAAAGNGSSAAAFAEMTNSRSIQEAPLPEIAAAAASGLGSTAQQQQGQQQHVFGVAAAAIAAQAAARGSWH